MNSKNFNAAEKHFIKKQQTYERQIKSLLGTTTEQATLIKTLTQSNQELQDENEQLKDWVNRLLEYTELSPEDIKATCEKNKRLAEVYGMFSFMKNHMPY